MVTPYLGYHRSTKEKSLFWIFVKNLNKIHVKAFAVQFEYSTFDVNTEFFEYKNEKGFESSN